MVLAHPALLETPVTCPSLLRRHPAVDVVTETASAVVGSASELRASSERRYARWVQQLRNGDQGGAQLARFAGVGLISSVLYAVLFLVFDGLGHQPANIVGALGSTVLANELHRRLTFHADGRVSWFTAQWEGGGLAVVGLVATSLALAGLDQLVDDASWQLQLVLIAAVTGAIGLVRFVALRAWVFTSATLRRS